MLSIFFYYKRYANAIVAKNIRRRRRVTPSSPPMGKSVVNTTMGPPIAQKQLQ